MKIKCPFCKHVYDPEAQKNQCPSCGKKLLAPPIRRVSKPAPPPAAAARKLAVQAHQPVRIEPPELTETEPPPPLPKATTRGTKPAPPSPAPKPAPPPAAPAPKPAPAPASAAPSGPPTVAPAATAAKPAWPAHDLIITSRPIGSERPDTIIRLPLAAAQTSLMVADYVKQLVKTAGLNFDQLCQMAEHNGQLGGLVEIKTKTDIVRLAVAEAS